MSSVRRPFGSIIDLSPVPWSVFWLLLGVGFLVGCAAEESTESALGDSNAVGASLRPLAVGVIEVPAASGFWWERRILGRVESSRRVELGFALGGTLSAVEVDVGAQVVHGQVLGRLDTRRLEAQREAVVAAEAEAAARLRLAAQTRLRQEESAKQRDFPLQSLDEAVQAEEVARATVDRLGAERRAIEVSLDESVLRAPFNAQVEARYRDEGAILAPGEPVLRLGEVGKWEVAFNVTPEQAEVLPVGQRVTLFRPGVVGVAGNSRGPEGDVAGAFAGVVTARVDVREVATRAIPVRVTLLETPEIAPAEARRPGELPVATLRDGDLLEVTLRQWREVSGYEVPRSALIPGLRGLWTVLLAVPAPPAGSGEAVTRGSDATGPRWVVQRQEVSLLHLQGEVAFVQGDLPREARLIVEGGHRVAVGQRVSSVLSSASDHNPVRGAGAR